MSSLAFKIKRLLRLIPSTDAGSESGDIRMDSADSKLKLHNGTDEKILIRADQLSDLEYDNGTSGLAATDAQAAIDEVDGDLDGHIGLSSGVHGVTGSVVGTSDVQTLSNKTFSDKTDFASGAGNGIDVSSAGVVEAFASAGANNISIGGATSNVVIPGDLEVQGTTTTIDTSTLDVTDKNITVNNTGTDASSEGAGLTVERTGTDGSFVYEDALASKFKLGALGSEKEIVDVSSSQTLTNKTIDADNSTITNLAHGAEVDNPSSGVHGVTGSVVGTTDTQALTNKDIDGGTAANNRRVTIPQDTKTNLDSLTRKEGTLVYANDDDTLYIDDGTTLNAVGGGSGAVPDSEVHLKAPNGFGSTNTKIRRFTTVKVNKGSDLTLTQSATDGDSVTINTTGLYSITYNDLNGSGSECFGASVNSTELTTDIDLITDADRLFYNCLDAGRRSDFTMIKKLTATDVVRPHAQGSSTNTQDYLHFQIIRIA